MKQRDPHSTSSQEKHRLAILGDATVGCPRLLLLRILFVDVDGVLNVGIYDPWRWNRWRLGDATTSAHSAHRGPGMGMDFAFCMDFLRQKRAIP